MRVPIRFKPVSSDDIIERVDMATLLSDMGFEDVDPHMDEQLLFCIFHNDTATKSFSVNLSKRVFHCFSGACGVKGSAISLYALWKNVTYDQALKELAFLPKQRSMERLQQGLVQPPQTSVRERLTTLTQFVADMPLLTTRYPSWRGISQSILDRFGLCWYEESKISMGEQAMFRAGIANVWMKPVFWRHPILIPFWLGQSVTFVQGRQDKTDPMVPKYMGARGGIPCLWNHGALYARPSQVFVAEGVVDALSLEQMGHSPAVGVVGTEGFKDDWLVDFREIGRVWIASDNDPAGLGMFLDLKKRLSSVGCDVQRFVIPSEHKDVNSLLTA